MCTYMYVVVYRDWLGPAYGGVQEPADVADVGGGQKTADIWSNKINIRRQCNSLSA